MRLSQKIKKGIFLLLICTLALSTSAQKTFKYQASLNKVDSSGFYKIGLSPDLVAKSNNDLSDIRLMDQKGNFVPYINNNSLPQVEKQKFIIFPQIPLKSNTDTGTTFIVESKGKYPVSTLWVKLNNTDVKRTVNLSGSDDLNKWFAIEENIPLQGADLNNEGTYLQSLSFPGSSYRYLKLLVNDKNKIPIKFLEAGIYTQKSTDILYSSIASFAPIVKKDSNKISYITISLNNNYQVDLLQLKVNGPQYYKRDIAVYQLDKQGHHLICSAKLNSNKPADIFLSAKTNKLELQINNDDNLPLNINQVKVLQADRYIIGYLEAGRSYKLLTGDLKAVTPEYDLKFFTDSIKDNIPRISHGTAEKNIAFEIFKPTVKHNYTILLWISIVIALFLLSLLTRKMMTEVDKKTNTDD